MSKRHASSLLLLYRGVLRDAAAVDQTLSRGLERDFLRLEALYADHGDTLFTVLLPAVGKALDLALDNGRLPVLNMPLTGCVSSRVRIPRLFQGIWLRVFDESGLLRPVDSLDPTFVLILRQLLSLGKKLDIPPSSSSKFNLVQEFYDVESHLPRPGEIWAGNEVGNWDRNSGGDLMDLHHRDLGGSGFGGSYAPETYQLLWYAQKCADRITSSLFPEEIQGETLGLKHGPGATAEFKRGGGYKYSFPTWSSRLEVVFPFTGYGVSAPDLVLDDQFAYPDEADIPSRLVLVPKDGRGPRLIAAEPTSNQWIQQGLARLMADALRREGISSVDFKRQDLSRNDALRASLTGAYATVDLKSASDRLSCWLVQRLFRTNYSLLKAMSASRTRYMSQDVDKKHPSVIELRKFATMGSALTFPVQSISFLMLSLGALCFTRSIDPRHWRDLLGEVRVYGDDIIVPVDCLPYLRVLLHAVGLAVNASKTFGCGNFRESCGMDAFRGYDVTPVKPKLVPSGNDSASIISAVDVSNVLHSKGLWHAAAIWRSLAGPEDEVPLGRNGGGGVWSDRTFCSIGDLASITRGAKNRFNPNLQRIEYLVLQPKAVVHRAPRTEGFGNLLQFFTEDPADQELETWISGEVATSDAAIARRWVAADELYQLVGVGEG